MKILNASAGLLTNAEVISVLIDRGCGDGHHHPGARSLASEKVVFEHLRSTTATLSRSKLQLLSEEVKPFNLTRIELLQLINLVPRSAVEVHLIVESCEDRLDDEQIQQIINILSKYSVRQPKMLH
jgi:DNA-directed RNA polymerase subunit F